MRPPPAAVKFMQDTWNTLCCHLVRRISGFIPFGDSLLYHELILVWDFEFQSPKVQRCGVSHHLHAGWGPSARAAACWRGREGSFTLAEGSKAC